MHGNAPLLERFVNGHCSSIVSKRMARRALLLAHSFRTLTWGLLARHGFVISAARVECPPVRRRNQRPRICFRFSPLHQVYGARARNHRTSISILGAHCGRGLASRRKVRCRSRQTRGDANDTHATARSGDVIRRLALSVIFSGRRPLAEISKRLVSAAHHNCQDASRLAGKTRRV